MPSGTDLSCVVPASRQWFTPTAALRRPGPPRRIGGSAAEPTHAALRYGFHIGELGLLVGENAGCEVIQAPAVARVPTTPSWLLGIANLRGALVPIFDLPALFGLRGTAPADSRFGLVFDRGEQAVGVLIARSPIAVPALQVLRQPPPLPAAVREFVGTAYSDGEAVWLEFDHRRFFAQLAQRMAGASFGEST